MAIINSVISGGGGFWLGEKPQLLYSKQDKIFANDWLDTTFPTSNTTLINGVSESTMGINLSSKTYVSIVNLFAQYYYDALSNVSSEPYLLWSVSSGIYCSYSNFYFPFSGNSSSGYFAQNPSTFPFSSNTTKAQQSAYINQFYTAPLQSPFYSFNGMHKSDGTYAVTTGLVSGGSNASTSNYLGIRPDVTGSSGDKPNPRIRGRFPVLFMSANAKSHIDLDKTFLIKDVKIYEVEKGSTLFEQIGKDYNQLYLDNYVEQTT